MANPKDDALFQTAVSDFFHRLNIGDDEFQQDFVKLSVQALFDDGTNADEEARKTLTESLASTLPELEKLSQAQRTAAVSALIDSFAAIRRGEHPTQKRVKGLFCSLCDAEFVCRAAAVAFA